MLMRTHVHPLEVLTLFLALQLLLPNFFLNRMIVVAKSRRKSKHYVGVGCGVEGGVGDLLGSIIR